MSGHSKWSQIKRQKGVADQKRGQIFTKLANAVTIAVKQGGGVADPAQNFKLRLAIEKAQRANMPKENIERATARGSGKLAGEVFEVIYEGFAPYGVSVIVEAVTDNPQRTLSEVKNLFSKAGGSFGQPGSVAYQFKQLGMLTVKKENKSIDDIFMQAADSGAEDLQEEVEEVYIFTAPEKLAKVKDDLFAKGLDVVDATFIIKPTTKVSGLSGEQVGKVENLIESLENLDDVQKVYSNLAYE